LGLIIHRKKRTGDPPVVLEQDEQRLSANGTLLVSATLQFYL
jgi:hypothetical protein